MFKRKKENINTKYSNNDYFGLLRKCNTFTTPPSTISFNLSKVLRLLEIKVGSTPSCSFQT
jgi:hypothetical protein